MHSVSSFEPNKGIVYREKEEIINNFNSIFNANDQQSLFEAISNNLNIINSITSIFNVSDN